MAITAPYNFVPLSQKVFFPDWADQVSHDIPFEDGISGEIVCELTTQTPVYVRNGGDWSREQIMNEPNAQAFFNVDGKLMIPGSSLKGMLRNVIEIATFGKMCRVDDHRYSVRDLRNPHLYQNRFVTNGANWVSKSQPAWLEKVPNTNNWQLTKCSCARVEQSDLRIHHPSRPDLHGCSSAVAKYFAWGNYPLEVHFTSTGPMNQSGRHSGKRLFYDFVTSLSSGTRGTIVFTGQPGPGKHMEFVFFNPIGAPIPVGRPIKDNFEFVHSIDGDLERPNTEWEYWKEKLARGGKVPVFLLEEEGALHSIGLAQMFKLPYNYGIHKTIINSSAEHFCEEQFDFAEVLFGAVANKPNGINLRGRVSVCHAGILESQGDCSLKETVLGAPKPTYYPNYLEQPKIKDATLPPAQRTYKTFMDADAIARGWKRYPARLPEALVNPLPPPPSLNVTSKFKPIKPGAKFSFRIKIHNLKPAELGALLWALEWGGNQDLCHSLGMGKPFGYGLVKIIVDQSSSRLYQLATGGSIQSSGLAAFKTCMQQFCISQQVSTDWENTEQIFYLTNMANPRRLEETATSQRLKLRTMLIENAEITDRRRRNEFQNGKDPSNPQWLEPLVVYTPPPPPPAFIASEEVWPTATLTWARNNSQLTASSPGQKNAIVTLRNDEEKRLVPEELHNKIFEKSKAEKAKVTIARVGNLIKIVKIELPQT